FRDQRGPNRLTPSSSYQRQPVRNKTRAPTRASSRLVTSTRPQTTTPTRGSVANLHLAEAPSLMYDWQNSCHGDHLIDQSSVDLIVNSTNMIATNCCSDRKSRMIDSATLSYVPETDLQFEEVNLSHNDFGLAETPPYSHDIYALHSPSDGYLVDLDDITAALDCDITMLDTYLHSTPCITTSVNDFTAPHPLSESGTHSSACEYLSPSSTDPVEEFFPDLCETLTVSTTPTPTRHRNHSSGSVHSTVPHYSPYSSDSTTDAFNEYRKRRDKNNLASQRSRQKRAEKMREMRVQKEVLERRNIELKTLLSSLEHQVADYKRMVLMVVSKSASFT
ncbi:hypothetical protein V3C99_000307, partial [Haemonchus contortus]